MKRKFILMVTLAMVVGAVSAIAAGSAFSGTKKFNLKPGSSGYTEVEWTTLKTVSIKTSTDQGTVAIKVTDPSGKTIARGTNSASFKTGKTKGKFKITVTNKTKKIQKVALSWIIIES